MFQRAGNGLSHTAEAKSPSWTMLGWPQAGQRRKTTLCVKSPGCARLMRCSAIASAFPCEQHLTGGQHPDLDEARNRVACRLYVVICELVPGGALRYPQLKQIVSWGRSSRLGPLSSSP